MTVLNDWWRDSYERHVASVARGEHDVECEKRFIEHDGGMVAAFTLCHCSKRKRESDGFTEPPGDELYFPPPACPRCDSDLNYDESWRCDECSLRWDRYGAGAEFTDVYGEDLAADGAAWEAAQRAKLANPEPHVSEEGADRG